MPNLVSSWSVYLWLMGLANDGLPCSFGSIDIFSIDESRFDEVRDQLFESIDSTMTSPQKKDSFKQLAVKELEQHFMGQVFARVSIQDSDYNLAFASARRQVRLTVDVLNFLIYHFARSNEYFVHMPGESQSMLDFSLAIAHGHPPAMPDISFDPVGSLTTSSMKSLQATVDDSRLFERVSSLLKRIDQGANEIEMRLLTAMIWFGRAVRARTEEESFLMYAIALESLVLEKERLAQLTYRLRLSTAHLLGVSLDERRQISREINRLYGIRSDIVHNGNITVQESDRKSLCGYALECIVALLSEDAFGRMRHFKELQDWLDERILG